MYIQKKVSLSPFSLEKSPYQNVQSTPKPIEHNEIIAEIYFVESNVMQSYSRNTFSAQWDIRVHKPLGTALKGIINS